MTENAIKIVMPELVEALNRLAEALSPGKQKAQTPDVPPAAPAVPTMQAAPTVPANVLPVSPPAAVPTAPVHAYTRDDLARAGAALVDAGKGEALRGLLQKYSAQAITQLDAAQYGAFATDMRGLGANI